ncbi:MAG: hypothetical protein M3Y84_04225 [Acidobacteriota bacterium]|nr:hypothetical protein [Acidobacteriota bacterium]
MIASLCYCSLLTAHCQLPTAHWWAYLWTRLSVVITPKKGGAPNKRAGNTLSILQKKAGGWVIFRDVNMLAEVP